MCCHHLDLVLEINVVSFLCGGFPRESQGQLGLLLLYFLLGSGYIFTEYYHDSVSFPETWSLCLTTWCSWWNKSIVRGSAGEWEFWFLFLTADDDKDESTHECQHALCWTYLGLCLYYLTAFQIQGVLLSVVCSPWCFIPVLGCTVPMRF